MQRLQKEKGKTGEGDISKKRQKQAVIFNVSIFEAFVFLKSHFTLSQEGNPSYIPTHLLVNVFLRPVYGHETMLRLSSSE